MNSIFHAIYFSWTASSGGGPLWIGRISRSLLSPVSQKDMLTLRWQQNERKSTLIWITFESIDWNCSDSLSRDTGWGPFPLRRPPPPQRWLVFFLLFVKGWCSFIIYNLSQILQKTKTKKLFYLLLPESKSNHNITTKLLRSPKCWMTHKGLESVSQILLCSNTNKNDMYVFGHIYSVPNIRHTECINMQNYFPLRPSGFLLM